jgi:hypothetical protein
VSLWQLVFPFFGLRLIRPSIPPLPLYIILFSVPDRVDVPAGSAVDSAETNGTATHEPGDGELGAERLAAAEGSKDIDATPGAGDGGAVGGKPGEVDVAGEEKDRGEEEGERPEGTRVQGGDEGCEAGGWKRGCWFELSVGGDENWRCYRIEESANLPPQL